MHEQYADRDSRCYPSTDRAVQTDGNPQGQIFWLDSTTGPGKSTIAQTIAYQYNEASELGASFCLRDGTECSNINLIFPTIAHQLVCLYRPIIREHVSGAMHKDPDLSSALASRQLEKLMVEPLEAATQGFLPCLIVIDALDECKDDKAVLSILSAIAMFTNRGRLFPLRFFITSRPVPVVQRGFLRHRPHGRYQHTGPAQYSPRKSHRRIFAST